MDFLALAEKRYSCRSYSSRPVDDDKIERILAAMRLAPSACNLQPFRLHIFRTEQYRDILRTVYRQEWFVEAPYVVAMVAQLDRAWRHRDGKNLGLVDATIAFDHLLLAAASQGLGSCWVAAFNRPNAIKLLEATENEDILAFSPIGYPNDKPGAKERKPISELVRFWGR